MSDQAPELGYTATEPAPSSETYRAERVFGSDPDGRTRYQRRSGSLPHLEDQLDVGVSTSDLPRPVSSHLRPRGRLRNLIGN